MPAKPSHPRPRTGRLAAGLAAACLALPALAQDAEKAGVLRLQLNKLEPSGDACRITLVIDNSRGTAQKVYRVDLFAFDPEGIVQRRVAVELGPLAARKTTVKVFDVPSIACPRIGRILLNDVLACEGGEGAREACLERTETETKAGLPFDR